MATPEIKAALASIPGKKAELQKAFDALQSVSSSLASFTIQWQDLEEHFSSIQRSIDDRIRELESKSQSVPTPFPVAAVKAEPVEFAADALKAEASEPAEPEVIPRPELISFCNAMDGIGLRSYICKNRNEATAIRDELRAALSIAPDPAKVVLDAMDGYHRLTSKGEKNGELQAVRRTCLNLLEQLQALAPQISPSVRDAAKKVAEEWMGKVGDGGDNGSEAMALLQLLITYQLVPEFNVDKIMNFFVLVARRKQAIDLLKDLGLVGHMPGKPLSDDFGR